MSVLFSCIGFLPQLVNVTLYLVSLLFQPCCPWDWILSCLQLATSPISASYGLQGCSCWSHCLGTFVKCLLASFSWKISVMKESSIAYQPSILHAIIVGKTYTLYIKLRTAYYPDMCLTTALHLQFLQFLHLL